MGREGGVGHPGDSAPSQMTPHLHQICQQHAPTAGLHQKRVFPSALQCLGLGHKAPGDNRDVPVPHTGSATATSNVPDLRGSTHHLVEGVAQQPVLVEDEEAALPFLQKKAERRVIPTRRDGKKAPKSPPRAKGTRDSGARTPVPPSTGLQREAAAKKAKRSPQRCRDGP